MLLFTKLQVPEPPSNLVLRPRLAVRLQAWERARLITITAPAGYGKTTFAGSWCRALMAQNAAVVGWVALDKDDNDPIQFVSYLAAALEPAAQGLLAAVQDIAAGGEIPPKRIAGSIINALGQSERPVILVLDDYHLMQTAAVHELLDLLLARAPGNFHCLLLARRTPPLAISRFRVQGQLLTLGTDDLKFTTAESRTFFAAALPGSPDEEERQRIAERMDGWGAGMQLAALALREAVDLHQSSALPLEQEMVAEYIVAEILEHFPERLRLFLLQTAILDILTAPLCRAVTQQADSAQLLRQMAETTALVTLLDPVQGVYRYHHLLQQVLNNQLEGHNTAEEREELHRRAAAWYGEAGDVDGALRHFEQSGDAQAAIRLVERCSRPAMLRGDTLSVERWFARLPAQVMSRHPRLALNSTWLSLFLERTDLDVKLGLVRLALAASAAAEEPDRAWQYELLVLDACAAYYRSSEEAAVRLAQEALAIIPPQYALERGTCHLLRLIYCRQQRIAEGALEHADEAIACYTRAGFDIGVMSTMRTKALMLFDGGHAAEAVQTFHQQLEFARRVTGNLGIEIAYSRLDFGVTLYVLNRIAEAQQQFEALLALGRRIDDQAFALCAMLWLKLCALAQAPQLPLDHAGLDDAEKALPEMFAARTPALTWQALRASVWLHLRMHNPAAAWTAVQSSSFNVHQEPSAGKATLFLAYAHAYLGRGRALAALTPVFVRWEGTLENKSILLALKTQFRILAALLYNAQGNHMGALKALDEALALIALSGYVRYALDFAEPLRPLLLRSSHPLAQTLLAEVEAAGQRANAPMLSEIELRVLRHTAAGLTRQQTAEALILSENTVKTHLKRIYAKFGAASRDAALAKARELGLLDT